MLEDACRIVVYAPLTNDERMFQKPLLVKQSIRETLQKAMIHDYRNPTHELLDVDLAKFMTKPGDFMNANLQKLSEQEKLDYIWTKRDKMAHFEEFRGKQFEWTLQESQKHDEASADKDVRSGKSYNDLAYTEAMDYLRRVEPDMIKKIVEIFEDAQTQIKAKLAKRRQITDTRNYRAQQKKRLETVQEESSSMSSSAAVTPIKQKAT